MTDPNCPYCGTPVAPTDDRRFVNGIKPVRGDGCEFCHPPPFGPDQDCPTASVGGGPDCPSPYVIEEN